MPRKRGRPKKKRCNVSGVNEHVRTESCELHVGKPSENAEKGTEQGAMSMCGLLCEGKEGEPPQLQCERCLSLYHPGCVDHQPGDRMSFYCSKCVLGRIEIKVEPPDEESGNDQDWSLDQCSTAESICMMIKKEPEDSESEQLNFDVCGSSLVIKSEPMEFMDESEWQTNGSTRLLWNMDGLLSEEILERPPKRAKLSGFSTSHIFPLPAVFAKNIDQHLQLTISIKGVNIEAPPFGYMESENPDTDLQVVLSPGVMDTLDRSCADDSDCYSFVASCNPCDPQNIILQDLESQKLYDSETGLESSTFCTTFISGFGEEQEYSPMRICHHCLFMRRKSDGRMNGSTVMSFTCFSCMSLRSSIITEDFSSIITEDFTEPQHVPTDPRSRSILDTIDAQDFGAGAFSFGRNEGASEISNGKDIQYSQRGHLISLPNRLLDRTRLTRPLVLTINGSRVGVPPNGKVLLSKQYGAKVFLPETIVASVGVTSPEDKSFIIMTSPNDCQNLVIQETGSKSQVKPTPSYHLGFFQTEITAALQFEAAYKMVFNKEPPLPPPALITDSRELPSGDNNQTSLQLVSTPPQVHQVSVSKTQQNGCPGGQKKMPIFCPFKSFYIGYTCFLKIIGYLSIKDCLRARLVCRDWKAMLMHYSIWQEMTLLNCVVADWQIAADFMSKVNTRSLDLRGLVHFHGDDNRTWHQFLSSLGHLCHLEDLELDKCPAIVLVSAAGKLPNLRSLSALKLTGPGSSANNAWSVTTKLDFTKIGKLVQLEILQLRGVCALKLTDGLAEIVRLTHLLELSLTTLQNLGDPEMEILGNLNSLQVLELGDCDKISDSGINEIRNLTNLTRLRLEYRPCSDSYPLAEVLYSLKRLCNLELVKFVLCAKVLETLENLEQLQSLVIWPETAEKEAEENTAVLQTLSKMAFLDYLEWGMTSNNPDDSAQSALFLDGGLNQSPIKSTLRSRSKTITISKVLNHLCSHLTETKIKVFKLKMPQMKSKVQTSPVSPNESSPSSSTESLTHSASLRYVLNFLKSKLQPERSVAASRRAPRL